MRLFHFRQLAVLAHEAPIDPVLDAPHPATFDRPIRARRHGVLVTGTDQTEKVCLRCKRPGFLAEHRAAQVVRERRTLAHRKHAGLGARPVDDRRDVTGGEDLRMRHGLKRIVHADESVFIGRQTGFADPSGRGGVGHPHHGVRFEHASAGTVYPATLDPLHCARCMHGDFALAQHAHEFNARAGVVRG